MSPSLLMQIIAIIMTVLLPVSQILESESNLRPIWLNNLECTTSDQNLPSCIREQNTIGFAHCQTSSIAAVDCGACTTIWYYGYLKYVTIEQGIVYIS